MKPVTNYWTTYRRLWQQVLDGEARPGRLSGDGALGGRQPAVPRPRLPRLDHVDVQGERARARDAAPARAGRRPRAVEQNLLVVTAGADHIAPRAGTLPLLDAVASADVTHLDRPGGHIGLMAGSKARKEIWPDIAEWLTERSDP
jgi:polyhydroxyalkanoate synthase